MHNCVGIIGLCKGSVYSAISRPFLNYTPGVGQERPVCANSGAKLISLNNTVGGDCHQFAVRNLELTVELNKPLMLPTLLWTETAATKDENHYPHTGSRPTK